MSTMIPNSTLYQPTSGVNPYLHWVVRCCMVLVLLGCLLIVTAQQSSVYAQETVSHTVRAGETLSSIARQYGVSVNALASYNGIANPNLLRRGQVLRIPASTRSAPVQPAPRPQTTPAQPAPAQPNTEQRQSAPVIYPSPTPTPPVSAPRYHTVRPNDTLYGIAARYGVTVPAIKSRNRLSGNTIYVGQLLVIP